MTTRADGKSSRELWKLMHPAAGRFRTTLAERIGGKLHDLFRYEAKRFDYGQDDPFQTECRQNGAAQIGRSRIYPGQPIDSIGSYKDPYWPTGRRKSSNGY